MPEITWEDVQKVYPNERLEDLQEALTGWTEGALSGLEFEVITKGARYGWSNRDQRMYLTSEPDFWPFEKGEILLAWGVGSREPFGKGRKSSKWNVDSKGFETYDEAKAYSDVIKSKPAEYAHTEEDVAYIAREYGTQVLSPETLRSPAHDPYAFLIDQMKNTETGGS